MFGTPLKHRKSRAAPPSAKTEKLLPRPTLTTERGGGPGGREGDTGCCVGGHRCVLVRPHFPPLDRRQCSFPAGGPGSGGVMSQQEMNEVIVGRGGGGGGGEAGWTWPASE